MIWPVLPVAGLGREADERHRADDRSVSFRWCQFGGVKSSLTSVDCLFGAAVLCKRPPVFVLRLGPGDMAPRDFVRVCLLGGFPLVLFDIHPVATRLGCAI